MRELVNEQALARPGQPREEHQPPAGQPPEPFLESRVSPDDETTGVDSLSQRT
jgi:hypothetical protein